MIKKPPALRKRRRGPFWGFWPQFWRVSGKSDAFFYRATTRDLTSLNDYTCWILQDAFHPFCGGGISAPFDDGVYWATGVFLGGRVLFWAKNRDGGLDPKGFVCILTACIGCDTFAHVRGTGEEIRSEANCEGSRICSETLRRIGEGSQSR